MSTWTRRFVVAFLLVAGIGPALGDAVAGSEVRFDTTRVTVITACGRHGFTVELAETWPQRVQGLQGRRELAPDHGMLFDFGQAMAVTMWMKNTLVPLDMLFIDTGGRIVNIASDTQPLSLEMISSGGPVRAVLELNAGTAGRIGARSGDRVLHGIFGSDKANSAGPGQR